MDRLGRRPLLLVPMVVMILILALITIALKLQVNFANVTDLLLLLVLLFYLLDIRLISELTYYDILSSGTLNCIHYSHGQQMTVLTTLFHSCVLLSFAVKIIANCT